MITAADIDLGDGLFAGIDIDRFVALQTGGPLRSTARGWLHDVLLPPGHRPGRPDYSFSDLVSAFAVAQLRGRGVSMQRIRMAHERLIELVPTDRPMAFRGLFSDGVDVFADLAVDQQITNISRPGSQEAARGAIELNLSHVRFEQGDHFTDRGAVSWSPMEGVSVNPRVMFGAPCIGSRRLTTAAISGMVAAGFPRDVIARDYEISPDEIRIAVQFEERLASIAA